MEFRKEIAKELGKIRMVRFRTFGGVKFYRVDGFAVRNLIDDDFVMGGHGYRYLYIPLDEIWIDGSAPKDAPFVFWHEYAERQNMARGMNYNDAHDLSSQLEIALRVGREFILPVRHFEQESGYSCGAASLRMVFDFFDDRLSEADIVKIAGTSEENGTDAKDMAAAAKGRGYQV